MSWFNLIKRHTTITVPQTKINIKGSPEIENDDCNRQLKEYADKLKNRPLELKTANDDLPDKGYNIDIFDDTSFQKTKSYSMGKVIGSETHIFKYNEVPENIACEFLELLKSSRNDVAVSYLISNIDDNYRFKFITISKRFSRWNVATLYINEGHLVTLGIKLSEYNYFPDDNNLQDIDIDWR